MDMVSLVLEEQTEGSGVVLETGVLVAVLRMEGIEVVLETGALAVVLHMKSLDFVDNFWGPEFEDQRVIFAAVEQMEALEVAEPVGSLGAGLNMETLVAVLNMETLVVAVDNFLDPEIGVQKEILEAALQMLGLVVDQIGNLVEVHKVSLGAVVSMETFVLWEH
jgi:hypothetical protein